MVGSGLSTKGNKPLGVLWGGTLLVIIEVDVNRPVGDSDGSHCGISDDVECTGTPGKELVLNALLVGPGAYQHRSPNGRSA